MIVCAKVDSRHNCWAEGFIHAPMPKAPHADLISTSLCSVPKLRSNSYIIK